MENKYSEVLNLIRVFENFDRGIDPLIIPQDYYSEALDWLKENLGVYQLEVIDERTGEKGFIGFGVFGEELYREIPSSFDISGKHNYLKLLFESKGFILKVSELREREYPFENLISV